MISLCRLFWSFSLHRVGMKDVEGFASEALEPDSNHFRRIYEVSEIFY